jgi:hypothetical protein
MFFREYDPALGRMNAVDPMVSKYASLTPYNYAFNDPVYFNDPLGDDSSDRDHRRYNYVDNWNWRVSGPQDAHAGSGGMYGGSYAVLINPGFTNAGTWSMIWNAWNSMGRISNGIGTFNYIDGELFGDPDIVDIGRGEIVSTSTGISDWRVLAGKLVTGVINSVSRNGGLAYTVAGENYDLSKVVQNFTALGIPIVEHTIILPEIEINASNKNSASTLTLISLVNDFGIAMADAQLILNSFPNMSSSKALTLLKRLNPIGGVLDIISHGGDAIDAFRDGDMSSGLISLGKVGVDVIFMATKANPWFLAGQAAWSLYNAYEDASSYGLFQNKR